SRRSLRTWSGWAGRTCDSPSLVGFQRVGRRSLGSPISDRAPGALPDLRVGGDRNAHEGAGHQPADLSGDLLRLGLRGLSQQLVVDRQQEMVTQARVMQVNNRLGQDRKSVV